MSEKNADTTLAVGALARPVVLARWLSLALFLLLAQNVFVYTPDDAFITYRYSVNVAEGYGPVFNRHAPAFDRTEGYSCPLFMFLVALLQKLPLGVDLLIKTKFLGLICGVAVLFLLPRLAQRLGLPVWAQAALPLLLSVHAVFVVSGIDGMESMLTMLLVTWGSLQFVTEWQKEHAWQQGQKAGTLSALLFAAVSLTRPEGLLIGLCAAGVLLAGRGRKSRSDTGRWLLTFLLPVVAWFLFRHAYYGVWMPNTYFAKNAPFAEAFVKGASYLLRTFFRFVDENPIYGVISGVWWLLVMIGAVGVSHDRFRRAPGLIVPLAVGCQAFFALRSGGDWMSSWRYMAPALALALLLSVAGAVEIGAAIAGAKRAESGVVAAVAGTLCALMFCVALYGNRDYWNKEYVGYFSWRSKGFSVRERTLLKGWMLEKVVTVSDWLNANVPPGSVVAYSEMGVLPYLSPQIRFLDVRGLTDRGIAHLPNVHHEQIGVSDEHWRSSTPVGQYLRDERKPDYILYGARLTTGQASYQNPSTLEVVQTAEVLDGVYTCIAAFFNPPSPPENVDVMGVFKRQ